MKKVHMLCSIYKPFNILNTPIYFFEVQHSPVFQLLYDTSRLAFNFKTKLHTHVHRWQERKHLRTARVRPDEIELGREHTEAAGSRAER